jgi:eukaryotic-like serine/threonine-protein kinase
MTRSAKSAELVRTVTDTEEGRAFFQRRLSVFGFCLFMLAGGSWLALTVATLVITGGDLGALLSFSSIGHFINAVLVGVLWGATRSGRRPGPVLHALDVGVSLGLIVIWGLAGAALPDPVVGSYVALLSFITGTLARAIVVPSTAQRTLTIGIVGALVLVFFAVYRAVAGQTVLGGAVAVACWSASAVTLATVASHTIFGLRREVQQARVLGQYTLETKIGEGGMGDVWRAKHALLRRPTAIKLLPPGRMKESAIERFEREVQLTASLTHPNTVAIYDYGRTRDGIFYYAMELLEGTDLERLVAADGPQPPGRVVHVLSQVCGALAEAHDLGLVHRDVKPANVLLSPRKGEHEFAKVVDFGLVKSVDSGEHAQAGLTRADTITGTPLYMAPEAIESPESVDARSDLYALAAVGWFMLVGRPVFEGTNIVAICGQHLHTAPLRPSAALGRELPPDLEDLLLACLEKKPSARPADARALRQALERCACAGDWTAAKAADWWRDHGRGDSVRAPATVSQTLAVDFIRRSQIAS